MLESITGFLTSAGNVSDIAAGDAVFPPAFWTILAIVIGWAVVLGIAYLVLVIMSCIKQKIPLSDLLTRSFASFKALYKPMLRYYIPLIILSAIVGIYNLISSLAPYVAQLSGSLSQWSEGGYYLLLLIFLPFIIATSIYTGVLDSSLAKSYYSSLKTKKFSFSWITWGEFFRLIGVGLIYFIMVLASFFLLGIPLLFLPVISVFLRFPLLNEERGIGETIGKLLAMLKKDFWNLFFFYFIYSLLVGFASGIMQIVPVAGYVAVSVIVVPISTLLSAEAYFLLNRNYELGAKKAR